MSRDAVTLESSVRSAQVAQVLTIGWMVIEGVVALSAGIAARSIALTAFGIDSVIELATATVVLRRLLAERPGPAERTASRVVGYGLFALVAYILASSAAALALRIEPQPSVIGIVLLAAAIPVMAVLWRWRLGLAERIGSAALRGDAACSVVCLYLSAVALGGLVLNRLFGWWWADPAAALLLIWWIQGEAREALEAARG